MVIIGVLTNQYGIHQYEYNNNTPVSVFTCGSEKPYTYYVFSSYGNAEISFPVSSNNINYGNWRFYSVDYPPIYYNINGNTYYIYLSSTVLGSPFVLKNVAKLSITSLDDYTPKPFTISNSNITFTSSSNNSYYISSCPSSTGTYTITNSVSDFYIKTTKLTYYPHIGTVSNYGDYSETVSFNNKRNLVVSKNNYLNTNNSYGIVFSTNNNIRNDILVNSTSSLSNYVVEVNGNITNSFSSLHHLSNETKSFVPSNTHYNNLTFSYYDSYFGLSVSSTQYDGETHKKLSFTFKKKYDSNTPLAYKQLTVTDNNNYNVKYNIVNIDYPTPSVSYDLTKNNLYNSNEAWVTLNLNGSSGTVSTTKYNLDNLTVTKINNTYWKLTSTYSGTSDITGYINFNVAEDNTNHYTSASKKVGVILKGLITETITYSFTKGNYLVTAGTANYSTIKFSSNNGRALQYNVSLNSSSNISIERTSANANDITYKIINNNSTDSDSTRYFTVSVSQSGNYAPASNTAYIKLKKYVTNTLNSAVSTQTITYGNTGTIRAYSGNNTSTLSLNIADTVYLSNIQYTYTADNDVTVSVKNNNTHYTSETFDVIYSQNNDTINGVKSASNTLTITLGAKPKPSPNITVSSPWNTSPGMTIDANTSYSPTVTSSNSDTKYIQLPNSSTYYTWGTTINQTSWKITGNNATSFKVQNINKTASDISTYVRVFQNENSNYAAEYKDVYFKLKHINERGISYTFSANQIPVGGSSYDYLTISNTQPADTITVTLSQASINNGISITKVDNYHYKFFNNTSSTTSFNATFTITMDEKWPYASGTKNAAIKAQPLQNPNLSYTFEYSNDRFVLNDILYIYLDSSSDNSSISLNSYYGKVEPTFIGITNSKALFGLRNLYNYTSTGPNTRPNSELGYVKFDIPATSTHYASSKVTYFLINPALETTINYSLSSNNNIIPRLEPNNYGVLSYSSSTGVNVTLFDGGNSNFSINYVESGKVNIYNNTLNTTQQNTFLRFNAPSTTNYSSVEQQLNFYLQPLQTPTVTISGNTTIVCDNTTYFTISHPYSSGNFSISSVHSEHETYFEYSIRDDNFYIHNKNGYEGDVSNLWINLYHASTDGYTQYSSKFYFTCKGLREPNISYIYRDYIDTQYMTYFPIAENLVVRGSSSDSSGTVTVGNWYTNNLINITRSTGTPSNINISTNNGKTNSYNYNTTYTIISIAESYPYKKKEIAAYVSVEPFKNPQLSFAELDSFVYCLCYYSTKTKYNNNTFSTIYSYYDTNKISFKPLTYSPATITVRRNTNNTRAVLSHSSGTYTLYNNSDSLSSDEIEFEAYIPYSTKYYGTSIKKKIRFVPNTYNVINVNIESGLGLQNNQITQNLDNIDYYYDSNGIVRFIPFNASNPIDELYNNYVIVSNSLVTGTNSLVVTTPTATSNYVSNINLYKNSNNNIILKGTWNTISSNYVNFEIKRNSTTNYPEYKRGYKIKTFKNNKYITKPSFNRTTLNNEYSYVFYGEDFNAYVNFDIVTQNFNSGNNSCLLSQNPVSIEKLSQSNNTLNWAFNSTYNFNGTSALPKLITTTNTENKYNVRIKVEANSYFNESNSYTFYTYIFKNQSYYIKLNNDESITSINYTFPGNFNSNTICTVNTLQSAIGITSYDDTQVGSVSLENSSSPYNFKGTWVSAKTSSFTVQVKPSSDRPYGLNRTFTLVTGKVTKNIYIGTTTSPSSSSYTTPNNPLIGKNGGGFYIGGIVNTSSTNNKFGVSSTNVKIYTSTNGTSWTQSNTALDNYLSRVDASWNSTFTYYNYIKYNFTYTTPIKYYKININTSNNYYTQNSDVIFNMADKKKPRNISYQVVLSDTNLSNSNISNLPSNGTDYSTLKNEYNENLIKSISTSIDRNNSADTFTAHIDYAYNFLYRNNYLGFIASLEHDDNLTLNNSNIQEPTGQYSLTKMTYYSTGALYKGIIAAKWKYNGDLTPIYSINIPETNLYNSLNVFYEINFLKARNPLSCSIEDLYSNNITETIANKYLKNPIYTYNLYYQGSTPTRICVPFAYGVCSSYIMHGNTTYQNTGTTQYPLITKTNTALPIGLMNYSYNGSPNANSFTYTDNGDKKTIFYSAENGYYLAGAVVGYYNTRKTAAPWIIVQSTNQNSLNNKAVSSLSTSITYDPAITGIRNTTGYISLLNVDSDILFASKFTYSSKSSSYTYLNGNNLITASSTKINNSYNIYLNNWSYQNSYTVTIFSYENAHYLNTQKTVTINTARLTPNITYNYTTDNYLHNGASFTWPFGSSSKMMGVVRITNALDTGIDLNIEVMK